MLNFIFIKFYKTIIIFGIFVFNEIQLDTL